GTIGLATVIPIDLPKFSIFVSLALLKLSSNVIPSYIAEIINSKIIKIQFVRYLKGIGVPDLHLENIANTLIPLPPLKKQTQIANHITKIRNQAKQLRTEAQTQFQQTKQQVEAMILGETP
ncbi:restriction endonuclease subunit S, partial [Candidatus Parabeggiatoa sp. HSG14]|uniref:restriction endonuclease subunit S n=1 Tax=Candidatus Parabeggiatoa sp. HSG14 TaxID=3055593 RepID=UPI0025A91402|nr:restriction endonuclease subunit S [Thiotrichales bacterium HSG14]